MAHYKRTHTCGELRKSHTGQEVILSGWVNRRRDHGGLIFIDLRDRYGITQLVFDPKVDEEVHSLANTLRSEWVLSIKGKVLARAPGMANPKMDTGDIEIAAHTLSILSRAKTPPFSIADDITEVSEELRLKYRYLDIRRGDVLQNLVLRHTAMLETRNYLSSHGFTEITTPILAKSTPEGARDYLVPSRVHPGTFYALPQSPQLFKQLMMISGLDRYFQIAQCFRDEDLRADRQPEFTQIDMEMSFSDPEMLMEIVEGLLKKLFAKCRGREISPPFRRMSYKDALENYGTDRPDLRFGMPLLRIDSIIKASSFSILKDVLAQGGISKAILVKGGADLSRKEIERYTEFVAQFGLKGLAWMKYQEGAFSSNIVKFFSEDALEKLKAVSGADEGDLLFIAAANTSVVNQSLDHLRRYLAKERGLIDKEALEFLWVVDFPLFEKDEETGKLLSIHHPFTAPLDEDRALLQENPVAARSNAYDIVLNGYELGGGSMRIHDEQLQKTIFTLLELSEEDIATKFGFFSESLQYGTPPHLGLALGLDRIMMLLTGTDNIRDVIAFPKTQKASDIMMQCPSKVEKKQLDELHISPKQSIKFDS